MNDNQNKTPVSSADSPQPSIKKATASILKCAAFIFLWRLCITTVNLVHQYINIAADTERYNEILANNQGILTITAVLMFFVATLAIYAATGNKVSEFFPVKKSKPIYFISAAVLGISLHCVVKMTIGFFSNDAILNEISDSFGVGNGAAWINVISIGVMVPLVEEALYRGLIFLRLKKTFPVILSSLFSSILFAFSHVHPISIIYSFIIGILFSFILLKRNNILIVITAHSFFNLTSFIADYTYPLPRAIPSFIVYIFYVVAVQGAAVILIKNSNTDK